MGCCISRCIPKRRSLKQVKKEDQMEDPVHDKNVIISHQATTSRLPCSVSLSNNTKSFPFSSSNSPLHSASSASSTSCTTTNSTNLSCSSRSSASSALLTLKDRSFSNEFLWSCAKENPHIIESSPIKNSSPMKSLLPNKVQTQYLSLEPVEPNKASTITAPPPTRQHFQFQQRVSTPQRRRHYMHHVGSPNFPGHMSFQKEPDQGANFPNRSMRSPSPSRRFGNGDSYDNSKHSVTRTPRTVVGSRKNLSQTTVLKENIRPATPNNNLKDNGAAGLRRSRERFQFRAGGLKMDEIAVAEVVSRHCVLDSLAVEDIDNPHVSLDCFIFI